MATPSTERSRGALIVVEGLDKAGKSSQCTRLVKKLESQGRPVKHMRFPDRTTPIGKMIDQYLKGQSQQDDHVIHLLFSANRWEACEQIKSDIAAGITLVIDRYFYSGCVYSAAKGVEGLDLEWARWPEVGLPRPDVCIFLDITPADAAKRGSFGQEKYETTEMQGRVRRLFEEMRGSADKDDFCVVDAGGTEAQVEAEVLRVVLECEEKLQSASGSETKLRSVLPARGSS